MITRRLARPLTGLASGNGWVCPSCVRSTAPLTSSTPLNPRQQPTTLQNRSFASTPSQSRHQVPRLEFSETFEKDGVPGLYSKVGFRIAWQDYQNILINKLNNLIAGEPIENETVKALILKFARDPLNASLFNYASAAHNNHMFLSSFSTNSGYSLEKSPLLQNSLEASFGTIDALRAQMLDTADAMFGPGYVWLVWVPQAPSPAGSLNKRGDWRVLATYNAGTPYPEAGFRAQPHDLNNGVPANALGAFGAHSRQGMQDAKFPPGGASLMPVLCVSTWEHSYIYDFGLGGKRKYLEDWWQVIDWSRVQNAVPGAVLDTMKQGARQDGMGAGMGMYNRTFGGR